VQTEDSESAPQALASVDGARAMSAQRGTPIKRVPGRERARSVLADGSLDRAVFRAAEGRSIDYGVSDGFWALVENLVPPYAIKRGAGRPPIQSRQIFEAVVYVLRTGCPWRSLPKKRFGSASSIHKRFLEWERSGFFLKLWQAGLAEHEELEGIAWRWQHTRLSPLGARPIRGWTPAVQHRNRA
jgi:transposase